MSGYLAPILMAGLIRTWGSTLHFSLQGFEQAQAARGVDNRFVCAVWHDELFPVTYLHRDEGHIAVVSQSKDGEVATRIAQRLGYAVTRGSSTRGGMQAVMSSMREMKRRGAGLVLAVDGPRGPRHRVKEGAVFVASKIGAMIIPVRTIMHRAKVFERSWDRFQLPLPFSRCDVFYGSPYEVPRDLDRRGLAQEREHLEARLNALTDAVEGNR
ncbi:MAG: DUF374 domain-containing protein [Deltaproteobacteria bacterium]|nr:DUF374 domain-containing protein [Deltaproteobacteria bacterium]